MYVCMYNENIMKLEHESVAILVINTLGPSVVPSGGYIQSYIDDSKGMSQVARAKRVKASNCQTNYKQREHAP